MNKNPFTLPGFGQDGPAGQNPILASMEMMRQAWEGFASSGTMSPPNVAQMMSVEEMDKRIADLRTVENWLRINLSMLTSTIQALEVQRATVATIQSFVDTGMATMMPPEEAAGHPGSATTQGASAPRPAAPSSTPPAQPAGSAQQAAAQSAAPQGTETSAKAPQRANPESTEPGGVPSADMLSAATSAAQGWWNLLQHQFQTLAAASGGLGEDTANAATPARPAGGEGTTRRTSSKAAARTAAKPAAKKAAKKASTRGAAKKGADK